MTHIDVITSYGADLATTTRAAVNNANRTDKPTGIRWGQIFWYVWPGETVEAGILRFHAEARQIREARAAMLAGEEEA